MACIWIFFSRLPLETMKIKIKGNLTHLEKGGLVSSKDNYQDLIRSIVQVQYTP